MSDRQPASGPVGQRPRIALAAVGALLLLVSCALLVVDHQARPPARAAGPGVGTQLGALAAQVQANIAEQGEQSAVQAWEVAHHEVPDPAETPPAAEVPAIRQANRVLKRWLSGYLPYEVDQLDAAGRQDLLATSTVALAGRLLAHPPLIPPAQQQHPPPEGRLLELVTTIAARGRQARTYAEVAYGLERAGFHLTLTRGGAHRWLVAVFHG